MRHVRFGMSTGTLMSFWHVDWHTFYFTIYYSSVPTYILASRGVVVLACRRAQPFWPQIITGIFHRFHSDRSQYSSSQMVDSFTPSPQTAVLSVLWWNQLYQPQRIWLWPQIPSFFGRNHWLFVQPWHTSKPAKRVCSRKTFCFQIPRLEPSRPPNHWTGEAASWTWC